jgi:hypothetical protein
MYKLINDEMTGNLRCIFKASENKSIPIDPANTDYQAYLKWLEEGNTPEPADTQGAA